MRPPTTPFIRTSLGTWTVPAFRIDSPNKINPEIEKAKTDHVGLIGFVEDGRRGGPLIEKNKVFVGGWSVHTSNIGAALGRCNNAAVVIL